MVYLNGNYFDHRNYYNTQYRLIKSKALGTRSLEKLDLADKTPFKGAKDPALMFIAHVQVVPVPDTRLAQIMVSHEDPREAARWANTLAEAYIEQNLESKIETTRNVYSWLQERLAAAEGEVEQSEHSLYEYTKHEELFVASDGQSIGTATLGTLNREATEAKTRRIEIESVLAQVDKLKQAGNSPDALPQIAADPLVQRLNMSKADLDVELVQLKNRYKSGHPKVKKVVTQIGQIQDAIDAQAEKIVDGMLADYQQLRRRERDLRASINVERKQSIEGKPQNGPARDARARSSFQQEHVRSDPAEDQRNRHRLEPAGEQRIARRARQRARRPYPASTHQEPHGLTGVGYFGRLRRHLAARLLGQHAEGAGRHRETPSHGLPRHRAET